MKNFNKTIKKICKILPNLLITRYTITCYAISCNNNKYFAKMSKRGLAIILHSKLIKAEWNLYVLVYLSMTLTHWGQMTHMCVGELTIIGSDNGLSPGRCQAIIWTNAGILLIRCLGKNSVKFKWNPYIFIQENAIENVVWKMAAILSRPQCVNIAKGLLPAWAKALSGPMLTYC